MKIYTRFGDGGETGLIGGDRVWKDIDRLEACGTLDELNAHLGMLRTFPLVNEVDELLARVQGDLFRMGAVLATPSPLKAPCSLPIPALIHQMEEMIDRFSAELPLLKGFILPGGTKTAALFHIARTVCRRAERRVVTLHHAEEKGVPEVILTYLNRLSDLLFTLSRSENARFGMHDVLWEH